jgi:hypothetical protein
MRAANVKGLTDRLARSRYPGVLAVPRTPVLFRREELRVAQTDAAICRSPRPPRPIHTMTPSLSGLGLAAAAANASGSPQ